MAKVKIIMPTVVIDTGWLLLFLFALPCIFSKVGPTWLLHKLNYNKKERVSFCLHACWEFLHGREQKMIHQQQLLSRQYTQSQINNFKNGNIIINDNSYQCSENHLKRIGRSYLYEGDSVLNCSSPLFSVFASLWTDGQICSAWFSHVIIDVFCRVFLFLHTNIHHHKSQECSF